MESKYIGPLFEPARKTRRRLTPQAPLKNSLWAVFICAWGRARPRIAVILFLSAHKINSLSWSATPRFVRLGKLTKHRPSLRAAPEEALASSSQAYIKNSLWAVFICAWGRARTADLSLFRRALYQLSYPSGIYTYFKQVPAILPFLQVFSMVYCPPCSNCSISCKTGKTFIPLTNVSYDDPNVAT